MVMSGELILSMAIHRLENNYHGLPKFDCFALVACGRFASAEGFILNLPSSCFYLEHCINLLNSALGKYQG